MRRTLGITLLVLGGGALLIFGFWSLILDIQILHAFGGFWAVILGFFCLPITLTVGPLYVGAVYGFWAPLILTICTACAWPLISIGILLLEPRRV
jgi:hypothetical protein